MSFQQHLSERLLTPAAIPSPDPGNTDDPQELFFGSPSGTLLHRISCFSLYFGDVLLSTYSLGIMRRKPVFTLSMFCLLVSFWVLDSLFL